MEESFEQKNREQNEENEKAIISALEQEIIDMEERKPDIRKNIA